MPGLPVPPNRRRGQPAKGVGAIVTAVVGHADAPEGATAVAVVARPASTIIVLRDGEHRTAPLEVLMLRRNVRTEFAGGAHVFPGGAVDAEDAHAATWCDGLDDAQASAALHLGSGGLAYWVAAVRECFEEAGLLFARSRPGAALLGDGDAVLSSCLRAHRQALNAHRCSISEVCAAEGIVLALDRVHYFAHWITPKGAPRRYDTRFFVAAAPEGQTPAHDAGETVAHDWLRPADALEAHRSGEIVLILPTIRNLQALERFSTVAEALEAAARLEDVPAIEPRVVMGEDGMTLLLPGDPGYDDPGPEDLGAGDPARSVPSGVAWPHFDAAVRLASRRANEP